VVMGEVATDGEAVTVEGPVINCLPDVATAATARAANTAAAVSISVGAPAEANEAAR